MIRFSIIPLALCTILLFSGCQETREDIKNPISEKDIYKKIGEEIPFETGMQWIAFYREKNPVQGRLDLLTPYNVSATKMNLLLESTSALMGVAFHYGLDDAGVKHILVIPVDETLNLWPSEPGRVFIDSNTGMEISQSLASLWAQNYTNAHPGDIWFHFFGKDIFDQMRALPYFESVSIEPATNIMNLTPQLLLVVWNDLISSTGRTLDSPATVYDASNACPPCAVK